MNPPILATRHLGLDIGGATIVADVSLEVAEGELLGIIGPNGAGKTSLFNLLSGLYRPTSGSIYLGGRDITKQPVALRTREGLGRTFQVSSVFPLLSVFENVRLAADKPILLLDEPMAGLSAEHVPQLVELIRAVHTDERKTVLMVEHHIDVVTGLAQRIAVMHHGALLACDTPAAVMANPTVQSAYLGEEL